tara:strand:+ start:5362 stop:5682 length:321 start_codon:yes stop_codon:yes gene_type:complete
MFIDVNGVELNEALEKVKESDDKMISFVDGKVSINPLDAMNTYMAGVLRGMYMVVIIMRDSKKALESISKLEEIISKQVALQSKGQKAEAIKKALEEVKDVQDKTK